VTVYTIVPSPIGDLVLTSDGSAITGVYMGEPPHGIDPAWREDPAPFTAAVEQLAAYFAGERESFDLELAPTGTPFQLAVWEALRTIPYGETRSYGDLARALGDRNLAQAVGTANGRNPIAVVVPCHRVIGADGSLVGYAGGLGRKRFLLALEEPPAADSGRLF
jgi:methylated-DNA-[protein]-cysteine S-methyltransferase